jgi:hypothetical protein
VLAAGTKRARRRAAEKAPVSPGSSAAHLDLRAARAGTGLTWSNLMPARDPSQPQTDQTAEHGGRSEYSEDANQIRLPKHRVVG